MNSVMSQLHRGSRVPFEAEAAHIGKTLARRPPRRYVCSRFYRAAELCLGFKEGVSEGDLTTLAELVGISVVRPLLL